MKKFILDTLIQQDKPMSVLEVAILGKEKNINYNNSSFYRQFKTLVSQNIITEYRFAEGISKYEIVKKHHHYHLICTNCNSTICVDIDKKLLGEVTDKANTENEVEITTLSLEFKGLCKNCK